MQERKRALELCVRRRRLTHIAIIYLLPLLVLFYDVLGLSHAFTQANICQVLPRPLCALSSRSLSHLLRFGKRSWTEHEDFIEAYFKTTRVGTRRTLESVASLPWTFTFISLNAPACLPFASLWETTMKTTLIWVGNVAQLQAVDETCAQITVYCGGQARRQLGLHFLHQILHYPTYRSRVYASVAG
ncbi:hypothetical protein BDZ97DRAFT_209395 [Flammula alnicola]|nr:hypothetical protein BDZ97DRAFT_209395 [Flammula alnicola]